MKVDKNLNKKREQNLRRVQQYRGLKQIIAEQNDEIRRSLQINRELRSQTENNSAIQNQPDDDLNYQENSQLSEKLNRMGSWVSEYHISHTAVDNLLNLLISFGLDWLPMDSRTLMKTPKTVDMLNVSGGQFWYDGVTNNLRRNLSSLKCDTKISLNINIDGLPLFDSSSVQLWPILINIHGTMIKFLNEL